MAVDRIDGRPLRQVASYVSSGTFTTPPGVNQLWVSVLGAAGSRSDGDQEGGPGLQIAGYVNTTPGQTHPIIIGARGTRGQSYSRYTGSAPTQGGTTSFDGAMLASSGGIGGGSGNPGTVKAETTVLPLTPAGAIARVSTPTTGGINNDGAGSYTHNNGNGMVWIYV